ncbi:coatomer subunit beta'-like [Centroberyx affinis]|uniref:coatomer subunit beta'-like n=1 Tax=Centroberyx affinis TaxID=166261 RepID=UPI003A5BC102
MPLRLDIKRKLTARSDRVKSVDLHPTEPWMVASLYSGSVVVWNHESQSMVKTFEVCDLPVRVAKFVARKHWLIAGADDMQIRVFNYNTLERAHMFEAHSDYIRCIAVHPTQPYILTSSDDMLIKLWDWDRKWACTQVFEGHTHYVMQIVINPKDNNQFASASLDRTIKVWQLGSNTPNFTLEGHEKGVNCIDYYSGGDKPYLISGADDRLVKIWDYQNKTCVQTLEGHTQNVTCVSFHPELPIILTGSEDGTVRVWHSNTYRLENTLNYGMERAWCVCGQRGSNSVALGYDEGSIIIKLGREEPAMSMDSSGKIMWARHSEVQQANLKAMGEAEIRDGERLPLGIKDMGSCEIYPQTIQHNPNGRFVVVCGDGEYIIYTAMALRNKSFGSAQEFVWAHDSSDYAIREGNSMVKIFKNFKEKKAFKPDFGAEAIYGGFLLGVRSSSGLAFYDWDSAELVRRIEIQPKHIFWSDSGELVCIATDECFFVLRYLAERVAAAHESKEEMAEDGIEDAFEVLAEIQEVVKTGVWVGDCFIYTNSVNRLNYYVGGEIVTVAHLDRTMYLLGYIPKDNRLYLGDKELNIVSYSLLVSVLEYQTAVMRRDFGMADKVLPTIPKEQRTRVANFLEKQGFRQQALAVSTDPEHRFELALQLGELKIAYQLALEAESEQKWKQLAELATAKSQFSLAQECLHQAQDYGGLLLLATASGNAAMVGKLAEGAERDGKTNVAFLTYFLQGKLDKCLDLLIKTNRLPEAAFLARTYLPSHVSRVVNLWKESLSKVNQKAADALADPTQYSNLFPGLQQAVLAEQYLKETHVRVRPAAEYTLIMPNEDRNVLEESAGYVPKGASTEPEEVVESMDETPMAAAVVEAASTEAAVVEEPIPAEPEPVDPVTATEEESIATAASLPPVAVSEEHSETKPAELVSFEEAAFEPEVEDTTAKLEEAPVTVEEDLLEEPITAAAPEEPEVVQTTAVEDVISSLEMGVQEMSLATDAVPDTEAIATAACVPETVSPVTETTSETIATNGAPAEAVATETIATEDVPVTNTLVFDADVMASEAIATEEMPVNEALATDIIATEVIATGESLVYEALGTDIVATEAIATEAAATGDTPVTELLVSESVPPSVAVEELISLEDTVGSEVHVSVPVPVQTFPELATAPALDPVPDTMPVMEPVPAQVPVQGDQATALPAEPSLVPTEVVSPEPEPEVLAPAAAAAAAAPSEGKGAEEADVAAAEEPAVDLEVEMNDEGLDDLDLDNFDLDDIDTTDVNLDDDFLND